MGIRVKYVHEALIEPIPIPVIKQREEIAKSVREDKKFYTYKEYSRLLVLTSNRLIELIRKLE
jgi:hypothetical protein